MTAVTRLLVANRGEIARRIIRSAHGLGIAAVAVFSDPDARAPHVREADAAMHLAGSSPRETYLDIPKILKAAELAGADSLHPGYGFLSENAALARACAEAGITFVGPSAAVIETMGSKVEAKRLMESWGVPVLPGALVEPGSDLRKLAADIQFPVLVKAAYGGGGRGMRVVETPGAFPEAVAAAQREAEATFADDTVFFERYVRSPRHIEGQIFGDTHGNVVHLFERECSIQRRHQKVIEEAPAPGLPEETRAELLAASVRAGKSLGYVGAGTVEFVLDENGEFYFLEVNARLQVEHPVTEMVTGLDLVALQLRVARGEPLPSEALTADVQGHAVEARLYAEDPNAGLLPVTGKFHRLRIPEGGAVRVDAGYEDGSEVSAHYDAMLAKVIAWAPTRREAIDRLSRTLTEARLHGPVTNRGLLLGALRHPEFLAGEVDTDFLVRHDPGGLAASAVEPAARRCHAVAAVLAQVAARRAGSILPDLPAGWCNVPLPLQRVVLGDAVGEVTVRYRLGRGADDDLWIELDGEPLDVKVWEMAPAAIDLTFAGQRRQVTVHHAEGLTFVDSGEGSSTFREASRFPQPESAGVAGSLAAPMPGTVTRILVEPGTRVEEGDPLVVLEAMKMEYQLVAPHTGVVREVFVQAGAQVAGGARLVVVEDD